jgi:hypothetical protein
MVLIIFIFLVINLFPNTAVASFANQFYFKPRQSLAPQLVLISGLFHRYLITVIVSDLCSTKVVQVQENKLLVWSLH